jgi:hypothetical protein
MENGRNIFLGGLVYYEGHLHVVKELHDNRELAVIQGVEEKYNKRILAHTSELASAYMCNPCNPSKFSCVNNLDKYEFDVTEYKCTVINGKIIVERL